MSEMMSLSNIALDLHFQEASKLVLDGQSRICNWIYNHLLEKANQLKKAYKENPSEEVASQLYSKRGLRNLLLFLKKEHLFLNSVHSSPLRDGNAALNGLQRVKNHLKEFLVPSSGQAPVMERWAWQVLPRGLAISFRGQNSKSFALPRNEIRSMVASGQKSYSMA